MNTNEKYPKDSTEYLIQQTLNDLVEKVKQKIYTDQYKQASYFKTDEFDFKVLGIIVSKYCEWEGECIEAVAEAAFADSNYHGVEINY